MIEKIEVFRVLDAGTFAVRGAPGERETAYGLYGVEAPDTGDPEFPEATRALEAMIEGKTVFVEHKDKSPHGRPYVLVETAEGTDVNAAMKVAIEEAKEEAMREIAKDPSLSPYRRAAH